MPGTTHARAAQTVTLGHHLLAHAWALLRDLERFDQWAVRTSVSPLGAGALATSTLGLDPAAAAARLGFAPRRSTTRSTPCRTGTSCRSSWRTRRSARRISPGWRPISPGGPTPRWAGPSSTRRTRPARASCRRSGTPTPRSSHARRRLASPPGSSALTSVLHGLPLGYHRDLQEDKEPAFDAADTLELVLPALVGRRRHRAVRRRGHARGGVGRGALRDRPRGGARAPGGAVPGGAPPDRRAAEAARRGVAIDAAISPPASGSRSGWPDGARCWIPMPPCARGAVPVARRRRASVDRRTRSVRGSRRARRSRRATDRLTRQILHARERNRHRERGPRPRRALHVDAFRRSTPAGPRRCGARAPRLRRNAWRTGPPGRSARRSAEGRPDRSRSLRPAPRT